MEKNNNRKYENFILDWNFSDENAIAKADCAIVAWIAIHREDDTRADLRVRDIIIEINPTMYANFTRGDKCRIGRAISILFDFGYYPELARGKQKGVTNTYHIK